MMSSASSASGASGASTYTYGHSAAVVGVHASRSAAREAAFVLPHLTPGMRLLDVGCGPGTITLGLAAAVAPAAVIGVDVEETVLERARTLAAQEGVAGVRFECTSALSLPYPDGAFDAVFAHTLLEHVSDPSAVLSEARRVLRRGGVVGVRDCDWGSGVFWPPDPLVERAAALYARVWSHNGGHPNCGRRLRALLRTAGFSRIVTSTSFRWDGSHDDPANGSPAFGQLLAQRLRMPNFATPIVANGWADCETLERIGHACTEWSTHPDAYAAMIMAEAVAWNDRASDPDA